MKHENEIKENVIDLIEDDGESIDNILAPRECDKFNLLWR
jgi:hypothetical protein